MALISTPQSLIVLLLLFLAGCGGDTAVAPPTPTPLPTALMGGEPVIPHFNSPDYGVHTAAWWRPEIIERDLDLAVGMGFTYVKQKFPWRDVEGQVKGQYDWYRPDLIVDMAAARSLKLVVRLDQQPLWSVSDLPSEQITASQPPRNYQDYGDYCGAVATRYQGRIAAYQVWNEPNLSREWGERTPDPVEYTALLRVCYEAIKAADPQAVVISAGLAPTGSAPPLAMPDTDFLQGMYDAGGAAYFDVLGLHAAGFKAPPETDPATVADPAAGYGGQRFFAFRHVEDMRAIMVANGDGQKQVAILEMGWMLHQDIHQSYTWHGVTEQEQADYLVRAYQYAAQHWQPWIGLMTTVYIADYDWQLDQHEQWWWAIVLPDGTPRLAYTALQAMQK